MERQPASVPPEFLDDAARSVEQDEEEACKGSACWARFGSVILRRGCTLGKKAVVASAALTSFPFVLPPLVFASAVSVALSLPFGVYLVSMACTDRLMKSLLPPPRALSYEPDDDFGAAKEEENDNISVEEGEAIKEQETVVLVDGVDSGNDIVGDAYEIKTVVRTNAVKTEDEESTDDSDDEFFSDAYPHTVESTSEKYEISMDGEDIGDTPGVFVVEQVNAGGKDGNEVQTEDEKDDPNKEEEMDDLGGSLETKINKDPSSGGISVIRRSIAKVGAANFMEETGMCKENGGEDYSEAAAAVCVEEPTVCVSMSLTPEEEDVSSFCVNNSIEKVDEVSAVEELVSEAERIKEEEIEGKTNADRKFSPESEIALVLEKVVPMEEFLLMKEYREEEKIEDKAATGTVILSFNALPTDGRDLSSSNKLQDNEETGTTDRKLVEEEQVQIDIFASPMNKESVVSPSNSIDVIANKVKSISLGEGKEEEDIDQKKKQDKEIFSFTCPLTYDECTSSTILEHQGKTTEERQVEKEEKLDINIAAASPKSKQSLVNPHLSIDVISYKVNSTVELEEREKEKDTVLEKGMDRTTFNNEKPRVTFVPEEMELKIQTSGLSLIDPYTGDREKNPTGTLQEDLIMRITETTQVEQTKEADTEISVDMILASIEESGKEADTKLKKEMHKTNSNDEKPYFIFVPEEMELKMQPSCLDFAEPDTVDGEKNSTEILQEVQVMRITETTQAEQRKEVDNDIPVNMIRGMNQMEEMEPVEQKDEENIEEELRTEKAASETEICMSTQAERVSEISYSNVNINYPVTDHMESNLCTEEKTTVEGSFLLMEKEVIRPPKDQDAHNETDDHVAEVSFKYYGETDQSSISSEYVSAVEYLSADIAEAESNFSVEHLHQKAEPIVAASSGETTVVPPDNEAPSQSQALYSEEQMWHQIAALRIILGCKATLSSSISEELKVLYILTGLEPPDPFKDTADLVDLSHKLLFLKVVIGVE